MQRLAAAEGLELKTREELARFDKPQKKDGQKTASNDEWESKSDADSRIRKMKDGSTHLVRCFVPKDRAENAVDLDTGVILTAEITPSNIADSASVVDTLDVAIATVSDVTGEDRVPEAVADKGDCKLQTLSEAVRELGMAATGLWIVFGVPRSRLGVAVSSRRPKHGHATPSRDRGTLKASGFFSDSF